MILIYVAKSFSLLNSILKLTELEIFLYENALPLLFIKNNLLSLLVTNF